MNRINPETISHLIAVALDEDLGEAGDITSKAVFKDERSSAVLLSKDSGVLAGSDLFISTMKTVDGETKVEFSVQEGGRLSHGNKVAEISGKAISILTAERVALNFLSYLSGIATATRFFVERASSTGSAVILDTRKTLPGYRTLAKYAVQTGGGTNHRMGLYDMVLLKDNHIDMAGSISLAVERVRESWGDKYKVEVECRTIEEVREAIDIGVDIVMLDNMNIEQVEAAVEICKGHVETEASGNITPDLVPKMSAAGVDYISIGQITHSVKSFDFSLVKAKDFPE